MIGFCEGKATTPERRSALSKQRARLLRFLVFSFSFVLPFAYSTISIQAASPSTSITGSTVTGNVNTQIVQPPPGGKIYGIQGGQTTGTNLFHSFGQFNVGAGDTAQFQTSNLTQNAAISNILGRINGQQSASQIFGAIDSATFYPAANLFLMNPNGFLFGSTATVNVGGMVAFTSADYLRLEGTGGSGIFYADAAKGNILTSSPVAAFGFLGSNPGAITVQGSQLSVTPGQSLSLVGRNITVQSGTLDNGTVQTAKLSAPGGQINLASVASPGEIVSGTLAQAPNVNGQSLGALGSINISEQSIIDVSGNGGGTVSIRGGQLVVNDSTISANLIDSASGPPLGVGGGVVVLSASDVHLENGATIRADSAKTGDAGTITIQGTTGEGSAATNVVLDHATVTATTDGGSPTSNAGAITITADNVTLNNGTYLTTDTHGAAPAGNITFNVNTLTTKGQGPIRLHVSPESNISNEIISETGVLIESSSTSLDASAGRAGQIVIQGVNGRGSVAKNVDLSDTILHARSFGGTAATIPSAITITADSLALSDQVEIYTTANGSAPAGNVALNVNTLRSNLNPDGSFIDGKPVLIGGPSEKFDSTAGPPGITTISGIGPEPTDPAKLVALSNTEIDTFIFSGSLPIPGPIIVTADTVALMNGTLFITTSAGAAPAGDIVINANNFRINVNPDGTPLTSAERVFLNSPSGSLDSTGGPPGTITISGIRSESTDPAHLVDLYNAQMSTATEGGSPGLPPGTITITADTMNMSGGTHIFSFTSGPAPAGNVVVNVNTLRANVNADGTLINGQVFAQLTSESIGSNTIPTPEGAAPISEVPGRAGTVTISGIGPELTDAANLVALNNTRLSTLVVGGSPATTPASIAVTANTVNLANSPNITTETKGAAPAGHLTFKVNNLTVDQATTISSGTSGSGRGGTITIGANQLVTLNNGSSISANSTGAGNAGNIQIDAGNQFVMTNSSVTTEATQSGGGLIKITTTPSGAVQLTNSTISASVLDGTGGGGSVNIDPQFVVLQNSQILAQAVQGPGGNIAITTNLLLPDSLSIISASSQFGQQGTISIQSPISPASGKIFPLSQKPLIESSLMSQRCAALAGGMFSTFTLAGRDMVPAEPGDWLSSPLALATSAIDGRPISKIGMSEPIEERPIFSLRRIAPPGFLTQSFAEDSFRGCTS